MIGIIGLAGGAATLMMGGATLAAGLATGAAGLGVNAATGTVRLAKDSIQALSPIGAGGSQARRRLMERGLIESGVNRTKQLKKMMGKTAGLLGVNVSLASILKQSQIFTGVFGTVFQILGAFVDIMLIPLMPVIKWVLNNMIDFIPDVQAASSKMTKFGERVQRYLEELFKDGRGLWGKDGILYKLAADAGTALKNWWLDTAWPSISDFWTFTLWPKIKTWSEELLIKAGFIDAPSEFSIHSPGADAAIKKMDEIEKKKDFFDMPLMPDFLFPKPPGKYKESLFMGGSALEYEDLNEVPEGYGGVPSAGSKNTIQGAEEALDRLIDFPRTLLPANPFQNPFPENPGFGMFNDIRSPINPDYGEERYANRMAQEMNWNTFKDAARNFLGSSVEDALTSGAGKNSSNGTFFSSTENLPLFATVRSPAEFRNMNVANNAIDLTNQSKDNYVARYHDEAAQYEDELYFQEMMLGVGRY